MSVYSKAICFFILPHTLIHVAVSMDQSPVAVDATTSKVSLVQAAVRPNLNAGSMWLFFQQASLVVLTSLQLNGALDTFEWIHLHQLNFEG